MSPAVYSSQGYRWAPIAEPRAAAPLLAVLESWQRTPYMNGQQMKRVGANCATFVCGVLDELYGEQLTPVAQVSDDAQFHDHEATMRAVAAMRRAYPSRRIRSSRHLPAGSVIVTGDAMGGPGHVMVVGPEPNTIWQCNRRVGVYRGGFSFEARSQVVKAVYEMRDLWRWVR